MSILRTTPTHQYHNPKVTTTHSRRIVQSIHTRDTVMSIGVNMMTRILRSPTYHNFHWNMGSTTDKSFSRCSRDKRSRPTNLLSFLPKLRSRRLNVREGSRTPIRHPHLSGTDVGLKQQSVAPTLIELEDALYFKYISICPPKQALLPLHT